MTISAKMSARQFEMLGEDPPGLRLELVHGEIVVSPSLAYGHSYTEKQLIIILGQHIYAHDLGEIVGDVDTIFDDLNVRRPDIIFIAKARLHLLSNSGHGIHFAPDLCVEILSPGSATTDQTDKFTLYADNAVPHYWLADPTNRTFNAFKLINGRYEKVLSAFGDEVISPEPFPELKINLTRIWPPNR
jgi:Uma2 family endonuclease